jgi:protein phosphatase
MPLAFEVAAKTDVGCVRVRNEDTFGYDTGCGAFVVCDGVGGQAAGGVASKIAVETILDHLKEPGRELGHSSAETGEGISARARLLGKAIQATNQAVREAANRAEGHAGMACTIACALVEDCFVSIGHVGDTRVYRIYHGKIQQLTRDHSLVTEQVRLGIISPEKAKASDLRNVLLRALGSEEMVTPDLDDLLAQSGDILVLASDGLTTKLSEQEILQTVLAAATLEQACVDLVQSAKNTGGEDNITCLLIRFVSQPWYRNYFRRSLFGEPNHGKTVSQV